MIKQKLILAIPHLFVNFLRVEKKKLLYGGMALLIFSGLVFLFTTNQRGNNLFAGLLTGLLEERIAEEDPTPEELGVKEVAKAGVYTEIAQDGDGLTHIARRVLTRYLAETETSLDAERRIFVEDFIQRELGGRDLSLGEEISVAPTLILEAVETSQYLQPEELENLKQYSVLVIF